MKLIVKISLVFLLIVCFAKNDLQAVLGFNNSNEKENNNSFLTGLCVGEYGICCGGLCVGCCELCSSNPPNNNCFVLEAKAAVGVGAAILTGLTIGAGFMVDALGDAGIPVVVTFGALTGLTWLFLGVKIKQTGCC